MDNSRKSCTGKVIWRWENRQLGKKLIRNQRDLYRQRRDLGLRGDCLHGRQVDEDPCDVLKAEGFTVETGLADVKTAFKGTFGSGKPVIGILGEFDALSDWIRKRELPRRSLCMMAPADTAADITCSAQRPLSAAIGIKKYLEESGKTGNRDHFGCPGEEGGSGKAFMAKGGVFANLDAAITWHPGDLTQADTEAPSPTIR